MTEATLYDLPEPESEREALPHDWLRVESLDIEAQGIAHRPDGKVVFVEGALPFELVSTSVHRKKSNWEAGVVTAVHQESSQRVRPGCPHFGLHTGACGGCKMQHLHAAAQVAVKQRVLEDNLWHLGKVHAETLLRPIEGPAWGYRFRARLSVRYVAKKGTVLVGFHERKSRYVADMKTCEILPPHVSRLLVPLPLSSSRTGLVDALQGVGAAALLFVGFSKHVGALSASPWPGALGAVALFGLCWLLPALAAGLGHDMGARFDARRGTRGLDQWLGQAMGMVAVAPVVMLYGYLLGTQLAM